MISTLTLSIILFSIAAVISTAMMLLTSMYIIPKKTQMVIAIITATIFLPAAFMLGWNICGLLVTH